MKKIKDLPDIDRPREKIARLGVQALSDVELIAAIIGKGVKGRDVLQVASSITRANNGNLTSLTCEDLRKIEGVGATKACQLVAAFELARRHLLCTTQKITTQEDILPLVGGIREKKQEHFICITLNGAGEVIEKRVVTVGLLNYSPVHPREVFADAITDRAASVIFVHNHPSGTLEPSRQDIEITRQLAEAGTILGIRVLDHIIVTQRGHLSMKEQGYLG